MADKPSMEYEDIKYEIIKLKKELEITKEFIQNYKEAAEFWKEKYDSYHKEMDKFIDSTSITLDMILEKQEESKKSMQNILEKLKETDGVVYNWIR